jgi:hypothetical protein
MTTVVSLSGAVHSVNGVNENVVECLRDMLMKAEAGEIVGFCGAVQFADNSVGTTLGGYRKPYPIAGALLALATDEATG